MSYSFILFLVGTTFGCLCCQNSTPLQDSAAGDPSDTDYRFDPDNLLPDSSSHIEDTQQVFLVGNPLPDTPIGKWKRIPIEGAVCQDGSQAGFSIRRTNASDDLLIYMEVGGACFNRAMCTISSMGQMLFQTPSNKGIFNFRNPQNPVRNMNMIYIPYCTGDVYAGSRENAPVDGIRRLQQFLGGDNHRLFLQRIVPTFPNAKNVVLAGWSAGGFGTIFNYAVTRRAFGQDVRMVVISDGGPPMRDAYFRPCLGKKLRELWDLNEHLPDDCTNCYNEDGGGFSNLIDYMYVRFPDTVFGLISAHSDSVIRMFFSYGLGECESGGGWGKYPADMYKAGLFDLKEYFIELDPSGDRIGTYYFKGRKHGILRFRDFYRRKVNGIRAVDWFTSIVEGSPYHITD